MTSNERHLLPAVLTAEPPMNPHPVVNETRALVLDSELSSREFLDAVAEVCHSYRIRPVVLTVAHSEAEALRRQEVAKAAFDAQGVRGDFDSAVGGNVVSSVTSAALWRRCTHAFVPPFLHFPWWRAWQQYRAGRLRSLAGTVKLLTVADGDDGGYRIVDVR